MKKDNINNPQFSHVQDDLQRANNQYLGKIGEEYTNDFPMTYFGNTKPYILGTADAIGLWVHFRIPLWNLSPFLSTYPILPMGLFNKPIHMTLDPSNCFGPEFTQF